MKMDPTELTGFIIEQIGGIDNIEEISHCSTRLNFLLIDPSKAKTGQLKEREEVITVIENIGNVHLVMLEQIPVIYSNIKEKLKEKPAIKTKKENIGRKLIDVIAGVFTPILSILSAAGIIKGLLGLFVFLGLITESSGTYTILYTIADGFFYFMPIFLGYTAAKKFNVNGFLGMAIGAALCYPTIVELGNKEALFTLFTGTIFESSAYTTFLGLPIILPGGGYTSTVIPVILAVAVTAPIEKLLNRVIPKVVSNFLVPVCCLLIVVPLTFLIVGPIAAILSSIIRSLAEFLYNLSPMLEGAFIGGFWQVLVIFGLHWVLVPIMILNLTSVGFDTFMQGFFCASYAQTAVALAIYLKTKDQPLKELALPAIISGIFGITEPIIYGVTLPRIKYFIVGCIASAIGGGIIGLTGVRGYIFGGSGIFAFTGFISPSGDISSLIWALVATVIAFVLAFSYTFITYKENKGIDDIEFGNKNS